MQIMNRTGGWQRLWILVSALLLLAAIVVTAANWPTSDYRVVDGIDSPECEEMRRLPEGSFQRSVPIYGSVCDRLSVVIHFSGRKISNRADYDAYLLSNGIKIAGKVFLLWLLVTLGLYSLGRAVGWVATGFRRSRA